MAWNYVAVSACEYHDIRQFFGARGFWITSIVNENEDPIHLGCVEEWDRDDDRAYFDYYIRQEYYEKYASKKTGN